jgi:transcriptional regulator with XRE-family HTH domain
MRFTEEDCQSIGRQLKAARAMKGHTQRELARALGVTREMVIRYEHGKVAPTGENLARAVRYAEGLKLPSYKYKLTVEAMEQPSAAPAPTEQQLELPLDVPQEFPDATVRITRKEHSIEILAVIGGPGRR